MDTSRFETLDSDRQRAADDAAVHACTGPAIAAAAAEHKPGDRGGYTRYVQERCAERAAVTGALRRCDYVWFVETYMRMVNADQAWALTAAGQATCPDGLQPVPLRHPV